MYKLCKLKMKKLLFAMVFLLLFITGCNRQDNDLQLQRSSWITEVYGDGIKAEMYMFPGPRFLKQGDSISLKFVLTNFLSNSINVKISVEDSADTAQFGGIQEPAELEYTLTPAISSRGSIEELTVPGTTDITYNNLGLVSFLATIDYGVDKEFNSAKFCLKYSSKAIINNCNFIGRVNVPGSSTLSSINYEYADSIGNDDVVDRMEIAFSIDEKCNIITDDQKIIEDSEVYLKNSGNLFECYIDKKESNQNHKSIRCVNANELNLNPGTPYYFENTVAKFKYDCQLVLNSGFIDLNQGG